MVMFKAFFVRPTKKIMSTSINAASLTVIKTYNYTFWLLLVYSEFEMNIYQHDDEAECKFIIKKNYLEWAAIIFRPPAAQSGRSH